MKNTTCNFNKRRRVFPAFLIVSVITGISFLINHPIQAESKKNSPPIQTNNSALKSFVARRDSAPEANVGERTSVWLNLQTGKSPDTTFYGNEQAISALQSDLAEPLFQTSADFNADGYPDLVSGFRNAAGGGLIALHRASRQAFEPTDEQVLADLRQGVFPATFEKDVLILDVPTAPDFIFAGKFTQDSAVDLVFASRGGHAIYLMTSDGNGGFNSPQEIAVGGEITALTAERLNIKTSNYFGVIAAVSGKKSSFITVFDGSAELGKTAPRNIKIGGDVTSLTLASAYGGAMSRDVFGLADGGVFTIRGIDARNVSVEKIELPFRSTGIAVGEFIADRQARAEIAVLTDNGSVAYLTHGTLDTRPFTAEEMEAFYATHERGAESLVEPITDDLVSDKWQISEEQQLGVDAPGGNSSPVLQKARLTGNETEDLLVTDSNSREVKILFKEPNHDKNRTALTGETKSQVVSFADAPAGVLPMRLNVMGQQGFVYFSKGSIEPIAITAAPNATFNVTKTADTNDGACNADCSLREAVVAANNAAGADMITFTPNGTHQLTINNAGVENAAAEGDLDVTQSLTVVGNGTANTIVQAGTNTTNGIDKVFSINPLFTSAFATSISNLTMRFGRNPSSFAVDGYGGAMDWEASGTGTLTLSGVNVDSNTATDGVGGGIAGTNSNAGAGLMTLTNVNVTNNTAQRVAATGNFGGGIFAGINMSLAMTTVTISNNSLTNANSFGGGIYLQSNTNGSSTFNGLTVTGNSVTGNGGGIYTVRGLTINAPVIISTNTATGSGSTGFGGGIYMNSNAGVNLSKATMVGNSAAVNGGAIALGSGTGAAGNTLNMSFSRIVGNTSGGFTGLVTSGGTANVENNWWGCNTGPSAAPCDTAGTSGGGSVDFDPWLRFTHTANPTSIVVGQTSTLTASFLTNSNNQAIAASNLDVLIGLPITFNNAVRGTISNAQATIQSSGTATATFAGTSVGAGSANAAVDNGTATANITVAQAATTTAVVSNANPSVYGQTVTLTATISATAPGAGTPTGTAQFRDNGNAIAGCASAAVSGGQAQCITGALAVGSHAITVVYSGDANFVTSTSPGLAQTVGKASTTATITSRTPNPSGQNTKVTVTFSVTVNAPGAGTPTGIVTVSDGVDNCAASAATGSCMIFLTTAGARTLTATYGGDANFNANTSAGVSQTVLPTTAAAVTVAGRVTANGKGLANAKVTLTGTGGAARTVVTNAFGNFTVTDVQSGAVYVVNVSAKKHTFAPQIISVTDNAAGLTFMAQ